MVAIAGVGTAGAFQASEVVRLEADSHSKTLKSIQPIHYQPPATRSPATEPRSTAAPIGCPPGTPRPVLLMPQGHTAQTIAAHPTFYAFVPAASIQFVVTAPGASDSVYGMNFKTTQPGIVRLSIPESAPALETGKVYWWYVSAICDPKYGHDCEYVQGWVERVSPTPKLLKDLTQAQAGDRPAIYAATGLWYDTLMALDNLMRRHPNNPTLKTAWSDLLKSVGLVQIAGLSPFSPSP